MENKDMVLNMPEFKKLMKVSRATSYAIANDPSFYPAFRVGRRLLINRQLLEKWIAEQCKTDSGNVA